MRSVFKSFLALFTAATLLPVPALAFQSPLSDEAVREAYFLGQRHDESMARALSRYTQFLPPPETGPHIYSVTFYTPFALLVQHSSRQLNYSAQQAAKDHHADDETVLIEIQIFLTPSYAAVVPTPTGSRSDRHISFRLRPSDFWQTFKYQVFDDNDELTVVNLTGEPTYTCFRGGPCDLNGAAVRIEFPAATFTSDTASILITPPEGDPVAVDFDLASLR